jgi:hypothetical protein
MMGEAQRKHVEPEDPRRSGSVTVSFRGDSKEGKLFVDGELWGAVEWSEKRGQWCIEDVEGQCLAHTASIRGQAASRDEAIALAEAMIRDGTMPTPEKARRLHRERLELQREKRAKQPAEIRKAQAREEEQRLWDAHCTTELPDRYGTPFYEIFDAAFDLADPNLWRSNSFAMLRPRLLVKVRAAVAELELEVHRRRTGKSGWSRHGEDLERKLARACEILALLDDGSTRRRTRRGP